MSHKKPGRKMDNRGEYGGSLPARPDEKMGHLIEYPFSNTPHAITSAIKKTLKHHMSRKRRQRDKSSILKENHA